jgi:hypothetical protein
VPRSLKFSLWSGSGATSWVGLFAAAGRGRLESAPAPAGGGEGGTATHHYILIRLDQIRLRRHLQYLCWWRSGVVVIIISRLHFVVSFSVLARSLTVSLCTAGGAGSCEDRSREKQDRRGRTGQGRVRSLGETPIAVGYARCGVVWRVACLELFISFVFVVKQ